MRAPVFIHPAVDHRGLSSLREQKQRGEEEFANSR